MEEATNEECIYFQRGFFHHQYIDLEGFLYQDKNKDSEITILEAESALISLIESGENFHKFFHGEQECKSRHLLKCAFASSARLHFSLVKY